MPLFADFRFLLSTSFILHPTYRYLAKREPTQHLMDESLRSADAQYLPWRIVHLVKVPVRSKK